MGEIKYGNFKTAGLLATAHQSDERKKIQMVFI